MYARVLTGVPTLAEVVNRVKKMKTQRTAGVKVRDMLDLKRLAARMEMPALNTTALALPNDMLVPGQLIQSETGPRTLCAALAKVGASLAIPMDNISYSVHGQCFTGPVQIGWVLQLLGMPKKFCLHVDGKHKLHHGGFVLISVGTHYLRYDPHHTKLTTSFAPLVYLMCKEQETCGAARILIDALDNVSVTYGGAHLQPGASFSDHSDAFRNAIVELYGCPHGSCYPHIVRKWSEGEYMSKNWEHFDEAKHHIWCVNHAHTEQMKDLLIYEIGEVWESWGLPEGLKRFWNSNMQGAWSAWSIGEFECMLATPSQQALLMHVPFSRPTTPSLRRPTAVLLRVRACVCVRVCVCVCANKTACARTQAQESWHKQILRSKIPGQFKGSTEHVLTHAIPQLITIDGLHLPSVLTFDVPVVPRGVLQRAKWYVDRKETHIMIEYDYDYDDAVCL